MNLENTPPLDKYLTLKEIKALFSSCTANPGFKKKTMGYSINGQAIDLLEYIHSPIKQEAPRKRILLYGGEDATEPIFSQTIKWILEQLKNPQSEIHSLAYDWYFVDCINPDGYLMNENWFDQPGDLRAFFDHSWEDIHSRMIFMNADRPEVRALHNTFDTCSPDFIFNMHDESHFPADGYKFAFSEPIDIEALTKHLNRVSAEMDLSEDELIIMDSYGKEPCFSTHAALNKNPNTFVFINEACGYKRRENASEPGVLPEKHPVWIKLKTYQNLLKNDHSPILESAKFHVDVLLGSLEQSHPFNTKMLSLTGYGLNYLITQGIEEAAQIKSVFIEFVLTHYEHRYMPVSVSKQVRVQLDALFTLLQDKASPLDNEH